MSLSLFRGDKRKAGTHYQDRLHRILGVCNAMGVLWEVERSTYHGEPQEYRVELVKAGEEVQLTPQYERYPLRVNPKVLARVRNMAPQFCYALNVPSVRVQVEGDTVFVCVPRGEVAEGLTFEGAWALAPDIPPGALLLGVLDDGSQACLDVTGSNVHAAVIGMTGSGKTTLLRTMILSAQMAGGASVVLCDPARKGFWPLCGHPSTLFHGLFSDPRDIEQCLALLAERVRAGRENGVVYVFCDEVPSLVRERPKIAEHLATLAERGRHIGLHLTLGAQHALVSELGPGTLRNIPAVLCGKVKDRQAAYTATGQADTGAELLRGGGDFLAVTAAGVTHFQAAQPGAELLKQWERRYPPHCGRLPPSVIIVPKRKETPRPAPTFVLAQSTANLGAVVTPDPEPMAKAASSPDEPGEIGRPEEQPSPEAVAWVVGVWKAKGRPPSLSSIYDHTKAMYPKIGGYGRPKAQRAIDAARPQVEGVR